MMQHRVKAADLGLRRDHRRSVEGSYTTVTTSGPLYPRFGAGIDGGLLCVLHIGDLHRGWLDSVLHWGLLVVVHSRAGLRHVYHLLLQCGVHFTFDGRLDLGPGCKQDTTAVSVSMTSETCARCCGGDLLQPFAQATGRCDGRYVRDSK
jgi:hypothetical protein